MNLRSGFGSSVGALARALARARPLRLLQQLDPRARAPATLAATAGPAGCHSPMGGKGKGGQEGNGKGKGKGGRWDHSVVTTRQIWGSCGNSTCVELEPTWLYLMCFYNLNIARTKAVIAQFKLEPPWL